MRERYGNWLVGVGFVLCGASIAFAWYLTIPQWQAMFGMGVVCLLLGGAMAGIALP